MGCALRFSGLPHSKGNLENRLARCLALRGYMILCAHAHLNNTERASYYYVVIQPINLVFQIKLCNFA